jgi:hypothetical protein
MFGSSLICSSADSLPPCFLKIHRLAAIQVWAAGPKPGSCWLTGYLRVVTPVVELPPPVEVRVITLGGGMLVKNTWNTPGADGMLGPMTAEYGNPVAWLMMSKVQVISTPGVKSVAVTTRRAFFVL